MLVFSILSVPVVQAEQIEGRFDCKIKSVDFLSIEEGQPKEYAGIKDGIDVGDSISLTYTLDTYTKEFDMKFEQADFRVKASFVPKNDFVGSTGKVHLDSPTDDMFNIVDVIIGSDWISMKNEQFDTYYRMQRYYKSDWHFMHTDLSYGDTQIYVVTGDCRHKRDGLDSIVDYYRTN